MRLYLPVYMAKILEEFNIGHDRGAFNEFFHRIEAIEKHHQLAVAMGGYNGWDVRWMGKSAGTAIA